MISSVAALLLVGCGGSTTESTDSTTASTDITVERGPVHGALVLDAEGEQAEFLGDGAYRFASTPTYPITADGGYIDIDRSGEIEEDESVLGFSMQTDSGSVITMATTVASNKSTKSLLDRNFGVSSSILYGQTPGSNTTIAAISDAIYEYCVDNNLTPSQLTEEDIANLEEIIETLIAEYADSNESVSHFEDKMFGRLGGHHRIGHHRHGKVDGDLNTSRESCKRIDFSDINISELTQTQIGEILYMAEEEKLARDVYTNLYETWELRIFRNIAKAENKHTELVGLLVDRYSLTLPDNYDESGVYDDSTLQTMYDAFITQGALSITDALEVGVAIEQADIADLTEIIEAGVPEDLEMVYERLLNGSQRHLSAFETLLDRYSEEDTEVSDDTNGTE